MKYLSIPEFEIIFEEWKSSGLSVRDYCLNTGFTECKFYYWKKKLQEKTEPNPNEFIPVQLNQHRNKLKFSSPVENNKLLKDRDEEAICELVYPNGVLLRINSGMTLDILKSLIYLNQ
ncbi:MAG: IS66 family insertion sequence element accessory protein TnpA [Bacteroidales bacterium]